MRFKLYQLKDIKNCNYAFMWYSAAIKHGFSFDDYELVYEGNIQAGRYIEDTLENIFVRFNIARPSDFHGHSMSMSDIVEIGGEFYYTDDSGFKKISNDLL